MRENAIAGSTGKKQSRRILFIRRMFIDPQINEYLEGQIRIVAEKDENRNKISIF